MKLVSLKAIKASLSDWRHWKPCYNAQLWNAYCKELLSKTRNESKNTNWGTILSLQERFCAVWKSTKFSISDSLEMENSGISSIQKDTEENLGTFCLGPVMMMMIGTSVPIVTKHGQDNTRNGKANASEWYIWDIHLLLEFQKIRTLESFRI